MNLPLLPSSDAPLLVVHDLCVTFLTAFGHISAIQGINFNLYEGETVALVGESGCGKSATAHSLMRLHATDGSVIEQGEILFDGQSLLKQSGRSMRQIRGQKIGMIFQDPSSALNPTMRIGQQIMEGLQHHQHLNHQQAKQQAIELLRLVEISQPEQRFKQYPHELSGGMRQRVMIAIALTCQPKLLIADEPTTALDVTVQAQILDLLKSIQRQMRTTILLITHDLGIVAQLCDRVLVMYGGKIVESGSAEQIFYRPLHPYTKGLLSSLPRLDQDRNAILEPIPGSPPSLIKPSKGCAFSPRCRLTLPICENHCPPSYSMDTQYVHCWKYHKQ
ncbi:MAG: ABC transporter ATP-binding protein [Verrucomicrobia bacterium]|nr:ABC transporter ATP-binding protein [Verrucomicrobiota bacterium]MBS0645150.1 ABC transporter ATP-binding protein [Verrucomicrobiota bacterium]